MKLIGLVKLRWITTVALLIILSSPYTFSDVSDIATLDSVTLREGVEKSEAKQLFAEDRISLQFMSGALFSPIGVGKGDDVFNYIPFNIRLGWMLNDPSPDDHFLRGNFEAILELSTSYIFNGGGDIMIGPTALIRYNFVQPDWKFIPYVQVGVGAVYTNAYEDNDQEGIGQALEFTPQGSAGFRYLISENWSIDAEFIFHHISNAEMADRNDGVNAMGGLIGFTYFFF